MNTIDIERNTTVNFLMAIIVCASLTFVAVHGWAQKTTTNPDGSTTTTEPDNTYGSGGTKETTTSTNADGGTVTREVEKDKDGSPMHATEKNGNDQTDITWNYDKQGRIVKVRIIKNKSKVIARKHYKDKNDEAGSAEYEFYNDEIDEWVPGGTFAQASIEATLKRFGLVLWPQIIHLTAGPPPQAAPPKPKNENPKQQLPEKSSSQENASSAQGMETAQLVGLVYDKDTRPGDQVTVSLTTDPKQYENIPALGVVEMRVPTAPGAAGQASLQGLVVDLGDGRQQPANQPLTIQVSQNATGIPVTLHQQGNATPAAQSSVPVNQSPSTTAVTNTGKASDFTTPPIVQATSIIYGPLGGNGAATHIAVDNQPASIISETPRRAVFSLPPGIGPGAHTVTLQDGQRGASAPIVKMGLLLNAGQLKLQRGQSTNYTATVQLGSLPDAVWQHGGGSCPDLMAPSDAGNLTPNFHVPQAGEPAVVFFRVENASRDTVTVKPSQNEVVTRVLHQQDFKDNRYTEAGTIQSKKSGGFVLNAIAQGFFAPISFNESGPVTGGEQPIARPAPSEPLLIPSGGTTLATAKADGWGGDDFKDKYPGREFASDLKICKAQNCGKPQEIVTEVKTKENGKEKKETKKTVYCKKDDKCGQGDKECPKASCHIRWSFIDGAKGSKPTGDAKTDKDNKERNEKWQLFVSDTAGSGDGTGLGKENAVPKDRKASDQAKADDYAYSCVCY